MSELFHLSGFGFTYPQQRTPALTDVELTIRSGEFWVLCGPSGCGKSTLLRQLKTVLAPHGVTEGEVYFQGTPLREIPLRQQAADIGFVLQSPEQQVVTDKVWHELAFGLESLGCDTPSIRRRVAEMASFFGIQDWFHRAVYALSGGQKQRLSVARALVRKPQILVLDDSSSALDYATEAAMRKAILALPYKPTLFIVSQRASSVMCADRILVLEDGRLVGDGTHKALLANCPAYCEIYHSQFSEEVTDA